MPDWTAFWAVAGLVVCFVLGLAWMTSSAVGPQRRDPGDREVNGHDSVDRGPVDVPASGRDGSVTEDGDFGGSGEPVTDRDPTIDTAETGHRAEAENGPTPPVPSTETPGMESIPTTALLANVLLTHAGLGVVLIGVAALTGVPAATLGVEGTAWSTGTLAVVGGLAFGGALAVVNLALAVSLDRIGVGHSEELRGALAPDSRLGWLLLLGAILPLVAAFEELLFRAVLIGAAAAATGISPWPFVLGSSIAFALGHGIQGKGGAAVTGLLGGLLGVAYVLTNSLLLVVLAHYVVNAVEFLLKEWLAVDLDGRP